MFNQIRHFVARVVIEPQVFERGARGIECFNRQAQFYQSGRGHVERLFVLPFGGQAGGAGGEPPNQREGAKQAQEGSEFRLQAAQGCSQPLAA